MIWNKNLLYPINDVWYHIKKLYVAIKLNHFFLQMAPHNTPGRSILLFVNLS